MKIKALACSVLMSLLSGAVVSAQESASRSSTRIQDALEQKKFQETGEITDPQLKAQAGSLSRYSLTASLNYEGPPLGDLSAEDQPNPDGAVGGTETSLSGSLGARYRLSPVSSVTLTAGLKALHPLHGGMKRMDLSNPTLSYDLAHRVGDFQLRQVAGVSSTTTPALKKVGQVAGLFYSFSTIRELGSSRTSAGLTGVVIVPVYEREYQPTDRRATRYYLAFGPNLTYNFSDRFTLTTNLRLPYWNLRSQENPWAWQNRTISQRVGLGFGFGRNAYVSPSLSFYPGRLAMDTTTINVSTVFSGL
ncbi:MAG: hypothetical protein KF802_15195 [Bdellovibrionaceae bacterium]|nr:hypothetical protein [Pseudobdellovibrionaceae bacterium]